MIEKYLGLSTGHVCKKTAAWLDWNPDIIMYPKGEYGWFVYAASEEYDKSVPKDLLKVIKFAKEQGCVWIMLDCDGETIKGLKKYNW